MPSDNVAGINDHRNRGNFISSLSAVSHRGRFKVRPESGPHNPQNDEEPFSRFRFTNNSIARFYRNTINPEEIVITRRKQELTDTFTAITTREIDQQHAVWRAMLLNPIRVSAAAYADPDSLTDRKYKADNKEEEEEEDDEDVSKMSWSSYRNKYSARKTAEDTDRSHNGSIVLPPLNESLVNNKHDDGLDWDYDDDVIFRQSNLPKSETRTNYHPSQDLKNIDMINSKPSRSPKRDDETQIVGTQIDGGSSSVTSSSPAPTSSSASSRHYDDKITLATPRNSASGSDNSSLNEGGRKKSKDWAPCRFGHKMKELHFEHIEGLAFNTASYGCTARVVIEQRNRHRNKMEANNVEWFQRTSKRLMREAKQALAEILNADAAHLTFVPNANTGTNSVLKSLPWVRGDYLLIFSTDYDATVNACAWLRLTLAIRVQIFDLQIPSTNQDLLRQIEDYLIGLKQSSCLPRLVNFCHVTSKTAYIFPAAAMTRLFHSYGISVLIDGAQAAGHIPLDLQEINPDFYVGTVHKWMYSSPGVGFLYVHPAKHQVIDPLVTTTPVPTEPFLYKFSQIGEIDNSGYISTKTSLRFVDHVCGGLENVQRHLGSLAKQAVKLLVGMWGTQVIQKRPENYGHMPLIQLPPSIDETPSKYDAGAMMLALWENHRMMTFIYVEEVEGVKILLIRLSVQIFHDLSDFEMLGKAVMEMNWRSSLSNAFDSVKALVGD